MRFRRRVIAIALKLAALLALCALPMLGHAHAMLERSDPAAGIVVPAESPPRRLTLWFTEPVRSGANAVAILNADNRRVEGVAARALSSEPQRVDVDLPELPQGSYLVRWRVTSADDHVVRGSYWFAVGFAPAPPPSAELLGTGAPRVSLLEVIARWVGLFAVLLMAGAPLFRFALGVRESHSWKAWAGLGFAFVLAHLLLAAAQAAAVTELPLPQALSVQAAAEVLFDGRFAVMWWLRLALAVTLAVLLCMRATRLAALFGLALLVATSLASHAVGARIAPALAVAVDSVHLAAAALWVGGLLELCRMPAAMLRSQVSRVSALFVVAVTVLAATGVFNAWEQVATWQALVSTAHGQSLLLKLAFFVPLLAIAAVNLFYLRPRLASGATLARRFLAHVRAELVLVALVILGVALLATLPPSAQQPFPEALEMARQAGDLRVALRVEPVWVGPSRFQVALADAEGRPPGDVRKVVVTFTMEGMNMGRTNVTLQPRGEGLYEAEGFYIGMPGISQLGVAVDRARARSRSAVFRIEVPDLNPAQLAGLRSALGFGRAGAGSEQRGRQLYGEHCVACHGASGTGNGPAAAALLPPPSDLTLHARWHPDEQLDWFISHGVTGTSMIGFADRLSEPQRRDVVAHLHALARAPSATPLRSAPVAASQLGLAAPAAESMLAGRLVFGPDFDNNLWLLDLPDGNAEPLTRFGPREFSSNPAWSPDGRQIAFSYYRLPEDGRVPVPDGTDLYVMNADGSALRAVAVHDASGAALQYPAWSADGTAVYVSYAGAAGSTRSIDRVSVRTGKRGRVVPDAAFPALSRDGRALAYVRYATAPERGESLWVSAPDGTRPREVVGAGVLAKYFGLRFSPDGRRLVFAAVGQPPPQKLSRLLLRFFVSEARANGDLWDLWVVDLDGKNLRPLTALGEDMPVAAWSPSGAHIAFLGGGSATSAEAGVTIVAPERPELLRLTTQPGHRGLDWR